jgi:hypothetical protein
MTRSAGSSIPAPARVPVLIVVVGAAWLHAAASAAAADTGPALGGGEVTVSTVMAPGSLVISVPLRQSPLAGRLQPIVVTDNRTADPGWTVTAILTGRRPGGLGWNPSLVSAAPGESIVLGPKIGLGQPRILATAASGASLGTALLDAALYPDTANDEGPAATFTLTAI